MKNLIIALAALLAVGCSKSETEPNVEKISNDPIFNEYCQQFDTDGDGVLSQAEAEAVTKISIHDAWSLDGLEHFPNLLELAVSGENITKINVSKNLKLKSLGITDTKITELDISNNTKLRYLVCRPDNMTYSTVIDILNSLPVSEIPINHISGGHATADVRKSGQMVAENVEEMSAILTPKNWELVGGR